MGSMSSAEKISPDQVELLLSDLRVFQQEQQEDPGNHLPPYHCGLIYSQLGDYEAAERSYLAAVERNPEFAQGYFNLALAYISQERFPQAEEAYRQTIRHNPKDAEPWANLGALQESQGQKEEAVKSYRQAIEIDPGEWVSRQRLGSILLAGERMEEAKQLFEEGLEADDGDYRSWNSLGLIAFRNEEFADAQSHYEKAIELEAGFANGWNNLGNLHLKLERETRAVEAYRKALEADPGDPTIWFNLGEFFFHRNHPETEKCLGRVVELDKEDYEAWEMLRRWYSRHPHYPSWKSVLKVLLARRPDDLALLRELSQVHEHLGEYEEAVKMLNSAMALNQGDQTDRMQLARLSLEQGQPLETFRQLGMIESNDSAVLELWYSLGQRLLYKEHGEEAESCFMKVIAHSDWNADAWRFLGKMALERGQLELALERFKRSEELIRNDRTIWLPLAEEFESVGAYDKAAECLDQLSGLLRYLTGLWSRFAPVYQRAGRGGEFLDSLEKLQWDHELGDELWITLAELFKQAGMNERAEACLGRVGVNQEGREEPVMELPTQPTAEAGGQKEEKPIGKPSLDYWRDKGGEHYRAGRMEEARECYQRALDVKNDDFKAGFYLGNVHFKLGRPDLAEIAFRRALEQEPDSAKVWYNLGCVLESQRKLAEAEECFDKTVRLDDHSPQAWNWLGVVRFHLGQLEGSRMAYVRSLAHDRRSAKTWHNLGVLYGKMGDKEKSAYCLEEVNKLGGVTDQSGLIPPEL